MIDTVNGDAGHGSFVGTLMQTLEMEIIQADADCVVMRMPVGPKTAQPLGWLHGGASVALAESAASLGTFLNISPETQVAAGLEINANHLRPVTSGYVTATAIWLHKGRATMVWDIRLRDQEERLVCVARCTMAISEKHGLSAAKFWPET